MENTFLILNIISNVLRAFLLKMNLPEEETEELVGMVKEKKMGYLFENMEKVDIQEERRNTAKAKEKAVQLVIEAYQESAIDKEIVLQKLQEKFQMTKEEAVAKLDIYWK